MIREMKGFLLLNIFYGLMRTQHFFSVISKMVFSLSLLYLPHLHSVKLVIPEKKDIFRLLNYAQAVK